MAAETLRRFLFSRSLRGGGRLLAVPIKSFGVFPVNINNNQSAMIFVDDLLCESSIPELKRRLRVVWHLIGLTTGL
jgi:hypothetical protein